MDDSITIRGAREDDAPALAELATHLGYPTDAAAMGGRLERVAAMPDHRTFVAERGGTVVGFVGVMRGWTYTSDDAYARILALVVAPGERGRGTGAALVDAAERWARGVGAGSIHVTTALHREGTHRFYERIGYARSGLRFVKKPV
ncbi:MAG TPA: GNAT family N-acetyltransferase [Longimicrobium sp.]